MSELLQQMFGARKPVIAMAHLPALPGTARYDATRGIEGILDRVRQDVLHLVNGGVDAILFCNEDDRPYSFHADFEAIAVMTRVITELRLESIPFGVDFLWDAKAPLAIAKATGAAFIREVVTGAYESDMGLWSPDAAAVYRYRRQIDADDVRVFGNITPEFASVLGTRSIGQRARSAVCSSLLDAVLISGPMAGAEPDPSWLREAKEAVGDQVPVLLNTGARVENIRDFLKVADGVIVGSCLKEQGATWNPVDPARVEAFMKAVDAVRP
jgi:membrane complex biogenesis BtpA family protein